MYIKCCFISRKFVDLKWVYILDLTSLRLTRSGTWLNTSKMRGFEKVMVDCVAVPNPVDFLLCLGTAWRRNGCVFLKDEDKLSRTDGGRINSKRKQLSKILKQMTT